MHRHKTLYVEKIREFDFCGNQMFSFEAGAFELPFAIKPTEGSHNYTSCKHCRSQRIQYIEDFKKRTKIFPHCCDSHSKLPKLKEFQKSHFLGREEEVTDKIMFTHHHIINHLDNDDWYENIVEYFEYVLESFGTFPKGFGVGFLVSDYIFCVKELSESIKGSLTSEKGISQKELDIRLSKIISYIDIRVEPKVENKNTDLNILLSTYDKWFKTFPFELSYFQHLKDHYRKKIPIFTGEIIKNRYSGQTLAKVTTKENLTRLLIDNTKDIITNINGLNLLNKGELNDTDSIAIELILKNRELQLSEMASQDNTERKQYIKILKKWFKEEQAFITAIKPLLPQIKKPTHNQKYTRTHIAYCIHYLAQTKSLKLKNVFPSDKAWTEIGLQYNKNAKNIQQMYNEINSSIDVRTSKTKIKIIEYVIKKMLVDYPKAQKLAEDELKIALLKS